MLGKSFKQRDANIAAMALDLAVLPLGLLVMLLALGVFISALVAYLSSATAALIVFLLGLALVVGAVLLTWFLAGRDLVSASELVGFGLRLLKKIPLYLVTR